MTNLEEIKQQLGERTEKVEQKVKEYQDKYYSNLDPWQRGLILLGVLAGTITIIYLLIPSDKTNNKKEQLETQAEERLIRRMGILKKLRD